MTNFCIDCGKEISPQAKRCSSCATKTVWASGVRGDYGKPNYCIDCGIHKSRTGVRCLSCASKENWRKGVYDGNRIIWARDWDFCQDCGTTKRPHHAIGLCQKCYDLRRTYKSDNRCADCGAKITEQATRCLPCEMRAKWERGDFVNTFDEEWLRRHSDIMRARWECGIYGSESHSGAMRAARQRFDTEEYRQRISEGVKRAWERGDFSSEEYRLKVSEGNRLARERGVHDGHSEALKRAWERGAYDGVFQSPTIIELQVAAALDIMRIEHCSQYRPDGYSRVYDEFVLPDILIEINGDYWHGDDFPEQQQRDAEKAQWAKENGFDLIVIWEHEINEFGAWALVMERVGRFWH